MEEMFEQATLADELGFDWISFSEHHYAPLLVPTPNPSIFAAAAIQRIRRAKIALFGPILPLHNPIHVAEEIAMLDVLSGGRLLLFLRGVPYELRAFSVNLDETRAMAQEATLLITRALTDPRPFSWEGKYYRYQTVSVWPGLIQRPHPPLYSTGNSFESATFAASQGHGLALSFAPQSYVAKVVPHYKAEATKHGWEPREDQIIFRGNVIATDTDEEAQQLAAQLATLPHLKRPQSPPAAASPNNGERNVSLVAPTGNRAKGGVRPSAGRGNCPLQASPPMWWRSCGRALHGLLPVRFPSSSSMRSRGPFRWRSARSTAASPIRPR